MTIIANISDLASVSILTVEAENRYFKLMDYSVLSNENAGNWNPVSPRLVNAYINSVSGLSRGVGMHTANQSIGSERPATLACYAWNYCGLR
jgi:hypothetical protein